LFPVSLEKRHEFVSDVHLTRRVCGFEVVIFVGLDVYDLTLQVDRLPKQRVDFFAPETRPKGKIQD